MKKELPAFLFLLLVILGNYATQAVPVVGSFDVSIFLVFILVVGTLIYADRKSVKLEGIALMRRTQRGKKFIDDVANSHRTFWNITGYVGVCVAVVALLFGTYLMISGAWNILEGGASGVKFVLPGPSSTQQNIPLVFVVPWWIWIIGISVVLFPHEFMHGIMCRVDKVKIKSVGWLLFLIIPGAFVEPDEKHLAKAKRTTKMKVYAAGSFINIATGAALFLVVTALFTSTFQPAGVFVLPLNDTPAGRLNLNGTLSSINEQPIRSAADLQHELSKFRPGETVKVTIKEGPIATVGPQPMLDTDNPRIMAYDVTLASFEGRESGYIGVFSQYTVYETSSGDNWRMLIEILSWMFVFCIGIGVVNILPAKPLDGGLLFEEIVGIFTKNPKPIVKVISYIVGILILFNLFGPIFF